TSCEPIWDKALCWPRSESNVLNKHSCPAYIPGFNSKLNTLSQCGKLLQSLSSFLHPPTKGVLSL
ncbi:unnamed protein product, partial [Allacma fusca]